ncbi:hypothetical protein [Streptomyces sp. CC208A]|uniref:hypothetical protein n=1 Tax=Streptomyces sp. CC208A TaxID=3044573 RepID=UPI0024A91870|nr:hypothetical protein [Streptomyces sp. CC208A]
MGEFVAAAFGFPTMLLTAAFAAVIGFWLLVLCGAVAPDTFDADADGKALGLGDMPLALAASVVIAVGWVLDLGGMVLLGRAGLPGAWCLPLSVALLVGAPALAWRLTKRLAGRWRPASPSGTRPVPDRGAATGPDSSHPSA